MDILKLTLEDPLGPAITLSQLLANNRVCSVLAACPARQSPSLLIGINERTCNPRFDREIFGVDPVPWPTITLPPILLIDLHSARVTPYF